MALVSIKDLHLTYGHPPLFEGAELHLEEGDRLCLLGRNGSGKSTLLRMIAGEVEPDSGQVAVSRGLSVCYVDQRTRPDMPGSAIDYCTAAGSDAIEAQKVLTQFGIDPGAEFATLSGGARRRVALAAGLAMETDVLLLDEPTNHLDIDAILWLEDRLVRSVRTLVLVTHDRAFAKAVSNRVAQIDRGKLYSYDVGFSEFLAKRDEQLTAEAQQNEKLDKLRAQEETWLARGVKARRTRDEGRVRALMRMREEYAARRATEGEVRLSVENAGRSGKTVLETTALSFSYPGSDRPVIRDLSTAILRGERVGIVGPNGSGKTTLVRLLTGELEPTSGSVKRGANVEPIYFDQIRSSLDPAKSVIENISGGDDAVVIGGKQKHINAYLEDYLFEPDRARMAVGALSGGEQSRVMLAKLFTRPSNLLVMDEPTNDLDLETLDLLEDVLSSYSGTLLLVTHDRAFLDDIVTSSLVLTGDGTVREFAGGWSDWKDRVSFGDGAAPAGRGASAASRGSTRDATKPSGTGSASSSGRARATRPRKRSYKESRELEALPDRIAELEQEIERLQHALADPGLYTGDGEKVKALTTALDARQQELDAAFRRWEELEAIPDS
ncbi:MAG: ATP-binding cassette domain-containing protein [Spirochaetota bacterium]